MITEENIEFVDWSTLPLDQITPEIIEKYSSSIPELQFRIWLEESLKESKIKHESEYENIGFYWSSILLKDNHVIQFNKHISGHWCSPVWCSDSLLDLINFKYGLSPAEILFFLRGVIEDKYLSKK